MKRVLFFTVAAFFFSLTEVDAQVYVNVNAPAGGNGSSWSSAFRDFQSGANAASAGEQVWVAKGTYQPAAGQFFSMKEGVEIYGGFSGTETALNQRNWKTNVTILHGNGNSVIRNDQNGLTNTAILDGFTISDGIAQSETTVNDGQVALGGGMYNNNAAPLLRNLIFTNNLAMGVNGVAGANGTVSDLDGKSGDDGESAGGGGIYSNSYLNLINVTFTNNKVISGSGGNGGNGFDNPTGTGGTGGTAGAALAAFGGAVYLASSTGTPSTFINVIMQNNTAEGGHAGLAGSGGNGVTGGEGARGSAGGGFGFYTTVGGALAAIGTDQITLVNTLITGNQAIGSNGTNGGQGGRGTTTDGAGGTGGYGGFSAGGGIVSFSKIVIINSTISHNSAIAGTAGSGGAGSPAGQAGIVGQNFGGGIYDDGNTNLTNSIILGNMPTETSKGDGGQSQSSEDQAYRSPNNIVGEIDPTTIFTDFNDGDYTLKPNSVVVNAGTNSYYDISTYGNVDVAGNLRIVDNTIDLGAYEYQANLAVSDVSQQSLQVYPNPTTGVVFVQTTDRGKLEVYNLNGQLVKTQGLETGKNTINLTNLNAGVYLLKAGNKTFKVIKN